MDSSKLIIQRKYSNDDLMSKCFETLSTKMIKERHILVAILQHEEKIDYNLLFTDSDCHTEFLETLLVQSNCSFDNEKIITSGFLIVPIEK